MASEIASGLTPLEDAVVRALLRRAGRHDLEPQLAGLRVSSREHTGVGFFADLVVADADARSAVVDDALEGVEADIDGLQHGAGFILFIRDGRLATLEGYTFDETWPAAVRAFLVRTLP